MTRAADLVGAFYTALGVSYGQGGQLELQRKCLAEEAAEADEALTSGGRVAIARELADVVYAAYGAAHRLGIPLDAVLAEVHQANMRKFDAPTWRADGKLVKPPGWRPPDVAAVLARHEP